MAISPENPSQSSLAAGIFAFLSMLSQRSQASIPSYLPALPAGLCLLDVVLLDTKPQVPVDSLDDSTVDSCGIDNLEICFDAAELGGGDCRKMVVIDEDVVEGGLLAAAAAKACDLMSAWLLNGASSLVLEMKVDNKRREEKVSL